MNFALDTINGRLMVGAILILLSVLGSRFSLKSGVPMLIFFIAVGISTSWFLDWVHAGFVRDAFKEPAKFLGVVTLTFILFSGGLDTNIKHVKPIWRSGTSLSTIGTLVTALLVGLFLWWVPIGPPLNFAQGALIGSIIASTDAAAVFSILRSRKIRLKANLGPLLELESGSNDVMVYFLMVFLLGFLRHSDQSIWSAIPFFLLEMGLGIAGGIATGYGMLWILNKINLPHEGLYPTLTLAMIFLPYGIVNMLHGSGYLAIYIAGIILGNRDFIHRKSIIKFYEGFGWLLQISMFIALGFLVDLETLAQMAPLGIALSLVLTLVVRPISTFFSLLFSPFDNKQKFFVSWVGLRGAVPIVFGTYLYGKHGLSDVVLADKLFHLIFFIVLISILIQGTTLYPLAKKLDLNDKRRFLKQKRQVLEIGENVKRMLIQLELPLDSPAAGKAIVDLGLPQESLIVLVYRDQKYFPVRGKTILQGNDKLFVIIDTKKELKAVKDCLGIV